MIAQYTSLLEGEAQEFGAQVLLNFGFSGINTGPILYILLAMDKKCYQETKKQKLKQLVTLCHI